MLDILFHLSNIIIATSIIVSLYLRLKYRRFGDIPKIWEKIGWLLMAGVVFIVIGDSFLSILSQLDERHAIRTRLLLCLYFLWYAITIAWVTLKKKKVTRKPRVKKTSLA